MNKLITLFWNIAAYNCSSNFNMTEFWRTINEFKNYLEQIFLIEMHRLSNISFRDCVVEIIAKEEFWEHTVKGVNDFIAPVDDRFYNNANIHRPGAKIPVKAKTSKSA